MKGKIRYAVFVFFILFWQGLAMGLYSQQSAFTTQYMNNPLVLNPAIAGNRNSVALDIFSRQQWIGIEGAPSMYYASLHAPVNKSMASIGANVWANMAGPVMYNRISFDYAYLLRVSHRSFLSLGIRAGVDHFNVNLHELDIIDYEDPEFSSGIDHSFRPSWGTGFVFFTPTVYFGCSLPHSAVAKIPFASDRARDFKVQRTYNLTGGLNFDIHRDLNFKFSAIQRIVENNVNALDVGVMLHHSEGVKGGVSYRVNQAAGAFLGFPVTDELNIVYSYEVPVGWYTMVKRGIHELTVSFDFTKHIIPNRHRRFLHKRIEQEGMESLRYF